MLATTYDNRSELNSGTFDIMPDEITLTMAEARAHAARVGRCTRDVKLPGQPQRAHFFALYTPVRAASPPQVAHPVNSGFFVSMPTRRPFSVPT